MVKLKVYGVVVSGLWMLEICVLEAEPLVRLPESPEVWSR